MDNTFQTNKRTELVALRAAESAGYLTIGSKKYLKDQLVGKRNGTAYDFVIRDSGEYQEGVDLSQGSGPSNIIERKVTKSIVTGNVMIATNILEKVTDVDWDREIAYPNGKKLINGIVKKAVNEDLGWQGTAFAGAGFQPLFKAQNFLASISDAPRYGFVDPMINSVLSSNGQAFKPVEAEPMSKAGLMGELAGVTYRGNQFMPMVSVSSALVTEMAKCSAITYAKVDETHATLTLTGVGATIPKGYVVWVDGVYATDLVGDKTSALRAFVAYEDGTANGVMKIRPVAFKGTGTNDANVGNVEVCDESGAPLTVTQFNNLTSIKYLPAGDYFGGFVRLEGTMEFESLAEIDASNADTKMASNEGINVFENRAIDVIKGSNVTRWCVNSISGIVEPRGVSYVLVADKAINQVFLGQ
jgi:hypothetical protein